MKLFVTALVLLAQAASGAVKSAVELLPAISWLEEIVDSDVAGASSRAVQMVRRALLDKRGIPMSSKPIDSTYAVELPDGSQVKVRFLPALPDDVTSPYDKKAGTMKSEDGTHVLALIRGELTLIAPKPRLPQPLPPPLPPPAPPPAVPVPRQSPVVVVEADGYEFAFSLVSNEFAWVGESVVNVEWTGGTQPRTVGDAMQLLDDSFLQSAQGLVFVGAASQEKASGAQLEEDRAQDRADAMAEAMKTRYHGERYTFNLGVRKGRADPRPMSQTGYQRPLIVIAIRVYAKGKARNDEKSLMIALRHGFQKLRNQGNEILGQLQNLRMVVEEYTQADKGVLKRCH